MCSCGSEIFAVIYFEVLHCEFVCEEFVKHNMLIFIDFILNHHASSE